MAKQSGGGALGWTLLGFLAGVAATLGAETLIEDGGRSGHDTAASASPAQTVTAPSSLAVRPVRKAAAAASAAPTSALAPAQAEADVADDAAAAGMTSRVAPPNEPAVEKAPSTDGGPANN
jgi:hypothetical protein